LGPGEVYDRNSRHDLCDLETKPAAGASSGQPLLVRNPRMLHNNSHCVREGTAQESNPAGPRVKPGGDNRKAAGEDIASEKSEHYAGLGSLQDCRLPHVL